MKMDHHEVHRRARRGTWYTLSQRGLGIVVNFLSSITFARLLPPAEFGIAAMATVLFGFLIVFRNFGLSSVTVQRAEISDDEVSFLFWVNAFTTAVLALVALLASPFVAEFFDQPRIADIMPVVCIGFLIGGLSAQHNALLRRELRFDSVVKAESAGLVAGFIAGLMVALWRHDAWAVVAAGLVHSLVASLLNVMAARWRPSRPRLVSAAGEFLRFGANLTVYSSLLTLSQNVAPLVIGRIMGAATLGLYNRGYQLFLIPNTALIQPVMSVMMPVFSRLQDDETAYRNTYLLLVERLSCLLLPAAIGLYFVAPSLTRVLLGPGWEMSGVVLAWLAPALAAQSITGPAGPLMISQGRSKDLRSWGMIDAALRAAGTLIGLQFGILGAAVGFSVAALLSIPLIAWLIGRQGPVAFADQLKAGASALPVALGVLVSCILASHAIADARWPNGVASLLVTTCAGFGGGLALGLCVRRTRTIILDLIKQVPVRRWLTRGRA
ncbi:lipopolysaccharide biosynthesis protein [Microvirga pudoricolor]|uniref:lipopolysaccharide biosynthesis protein n=1 Tax=Microvirga pudoricolor TaxID=2778729 RepID=UPI0019504B30|nr:lipopolysaccharide biosynthesis protein [Microvirga pudoricolor]MBM6596394.1 lipopolysaccharide biosynthesis protein [Microvirga pudoricolor]